jgi:hypothetical protein
MKDEALDLALEALKELVAQTEARLFAVKHDHVVLQNARAAIVTIKQALAAQPAPVQPVWIQPDHLQKAQKAPFLCRVEPHKRDDFVPLYTTPPAAQRQWVGLTDEEIFSVLGNLQRKYNGPPTEDGRVVFALAIEAKLKEKNT